MTNVSILAPVHDLEEEGPNLAQGTDGPRAGHDADLIPEAEEGPRVHGGESPTHETEAAAVAQGIKGKRRSRKSDQRHPQKATAVLGDPGVSVGGIVEAVVHLAHLGKGSPSLHPPDVIKKKRRRTRIVKRNGTGRRKEREAETRERAPVAKKRKLKIRNENEIEIEIEIEIETETEIESTSLTVRRET